MPRLTQYVLSWSAEQACYLLYERGHEDTPLLRGEDKAWFDWLMAHASFSFQGQQGRMNLLKETRPRGEEGYWYAYQRQGKRTSKRYVGRTQSLKMRRLEDVARRIEQASLDRAIIPQQTLLASKLHPPPLRFSLVTREHLLARLNGSWERKLTLLSAPAGFGKTTLASQWIAVQQKRYNTAPIAWLSLDSGDNDPIRFWRYFMSACQSFQEDQRETAFTLLAEAASLEPRRLEAIHVAFLNTITRPGLLVLEDYHVITEPAIHKALTFLLEHLPPMFHLIIITRYEPPLTLARMRASDELGEINATELRFTHEEIAAFLTQTLPFQISAEAIADLEARLEGWPAGLRLLAFALQHCRSREEAEQTLANFTGSQRPFLAYFISEVLHTQPEPLQAFLLVTSVLKRLTGSLCDAITDGSDSAHVLQMLDQGGLFLEPLDDSATWYRYHMLFAEAMQHEARQRLGEDTLRALNLKASRWYEQHNMLIEAIEAALSACDFAQAARLIERLLETEHFQEIHEYHTLRRWLQHMPEAQFEQYPMLCLHYATSELFITSNRLTPATMSRLEHLLYMAEQVLRERQDTQRLGQIFSFRSLLAWRQEEFEQMEAYAHQALTLLPQEELDWQSFNLSILARKDLLFGQLNTARQTLLEARALCEVTGDHYFMRATTNMLGGICFGQGELHQAAEYYHQVLTQARARQDLDDVGYALLGLAHLSYEWNELERTEQEAREVLELSKQIAQEGHQAHAEIMLARVQCARGAATQAWQRLAAHFAHMRPQSSPLLYREVLCWQARLALAANDLVTAQLCLDDLANHVAIISPVHREQEELLRARLLIAQEEPQEALTLLLDLLKAAREAERVHNTLQIQVLMALAYSTSKQTHEARQRLWSVLPFAHSKGYMRLFLDEGDALARILHSMLPYAHEKALLVYLHTILNAFSSVEQGSAQMVMATSVPLSTQEQRVLRLLAAGRSNPEIARELVVSVNTIRTQVQSIYRKLNVNNRVAASEAARQLDLL